MNIISVQRKNVLDKILSENTYYADTEKLITERKSNLLKPYQYLINEYGYSHFPIFGCPIGRYCEFYGADCNKNSVLIQLSVPDREIKTQDYYNWTDLIFYMERPEEWTCGYPLEQFFQDALRQTPSAHRAQQITVDRIEKAWITDTYPVTEKFTKLHNGSGGNNILHELSFYK